LNGSFRSIDWINTNKLLRRGFKGIKTGITKSAGPCLSSIWTQNDEQTNQEISYIVVVLKCKNQEDRFSDT
jgi:D-alanyl-D-alanine carboxypeptidase